MSDAQQSEKRFLSEILEDEMSARNALISLSKLLWRDELRRKECIVSFYNAQARFRRLRTSKKEFDFLYPEESQLDNRFIVSEYYRGNALYGISRALREYSDYNFKLPVCIEHGVYFGNYVDEDIVNPCLPGIITFSEVRCEHIRAKANRDAYAIGPYIHYANKVIDDAAIKELKKQFGKTLVVFPGHSISESKAPGSSGNDVLKVAAELHQQGEFETVLVCLYFNDFSRLRKRVEESGLFHVVCMGNRYDDSFLSRLKTLITLSDYTLSDAVGTHVGYCVCLNKPHWIVSPMRHEGNESFKAEVGEVESAFSEYGNITCSQREVVGKYWGLSKIRTPKELKTFFLECESILESHNR